MAHEKDDDVEARREKYGQLPPLVRIEETITSQDTELARDPEGGRNTDQDFLIRHAGG
jgi:hypothetical protein